ncbi:unnamed protein product [Ectocarpus sp. 6 AP-2014]
MTVVMMVSACRSLWFRKGCLFRAWYCDLAIAVDFVQVEVVVEVTGVMMAMNDDDGSRDGDAWFVTLGLEIVLYMRMILRNDSILYSERHWLHRIRWTGFGMDRDLGGEPRRARKPPAP